MLLKGVDSEFDRFRRDRMRLQAKEPAEETTGYENSALRELERVEAREVRDQQLTREVHEFFSTATQQAAGIVERLAHDAEAETDVKVEHEMESFLIDAFARMNSLVMALLHKKRSGVAETRLEPRVANLVGEMLDEFRWEGNADLMDRHIGQDPFATDVDDVRRELESRVSDSANANVDGESIEEHMVAHLADAIDALEISPSPEEALADAAPEPEVAEVVEDEAQVEVEVEPEAAVETHAEEDNVDAASAPNKQAERLLRFKETLKTLVREGTMSRDEARAAWVTRLQSIGVRNIR